MRHDDSSNHARRHSPARRPAKFLFAFAVLKLNAARAREVLPEKMRSAGLDRLAVLHDRFDRHRLHRAWKFFALRFFPRKNGNGAMIKKDRKVPIGLDPLCVARADDGFACWPDD